MIWLGFFFGLIAPAWAGGVVTLAPSLAEVAAEILPPKEWKRIVGVADYTDFPAELARRQRVGSFAQFNLETVVSLKPDLVLATTDGNPKEKVERLRELGLQVVVVDTGTLAQVEESFRVLGKALGEAARGDALARRFGERLASLRARWRLPQVRPSVLVQLGADPLVVVGGRGFLAEGLQAIGADNVYGDETLLYPRPSLEDVVRRKPENVWVLTMGPDAAFFEKLAQDWARLSALPAVQRHQVRVVAGDALARPSSRLLDGLTRLQAILFPGQASR